MKHSKYNFVKQMVNTGCPVLLEGPAGSGKTTIAQQLSEDLKLPFSALSMTKQTSMNAIIGFISVNGTYVASQFRQAYENGHLFLLDEIDAADPNVLLCLNSLENGYMAFPDGIIRAHKDFRLIATSNPKNNHSMYTGRSKLDFSTLDRYEQITIDRDGNLEEYLTSKEVVAEATIIREFLQSQGSSIEVTMRDAIRAHLKTTNNIDKNPFLSLLQQRDNNLAISYLERKEELEKELAKKLAELEAKKVEEAKTQHEVNTRDEWFNKITQGR